MNAEVHFSRYDRLNETLAGLNQSGVPLVAVDGHSLAPAGAGDDPGLFYVIPQLAHSLGISIDQSLVLFFGAAWLLTATVAVVAIYFLCQTWFRRTIAWAALAVLFGAVHVIGGGKAVCFLYDLYALGPIAVIPLFLCLARKPMPRLRIDWIAG